MPAGLYEAGKTHFLLSLYRADTPRIEPAANAGPVGPAQSQTPSKGEKLRPSTPTKVCTDTCVDMYVDMCVGMGVDMCVDIVAEMCADRCADTCVDMVADMCAEMRVDMRVDVYDEG